MREDIAPMPAFLTAGGEAGALMRSLDWSRSPLGDAAHWPQSLSAVVGLMLNTSFPMFVAWGPTLSFLYNDAYAEILGAKHPAALGQPFQQIWSEIWSDIYPIIEQAMAGHSTYHKNLPLQLMRKGFIEQTWFTFSYAPMRDERGNVAGVYCACTETTEQVLAENHRTQEVDRLRQLFYQAPGIIAVLRDKDHVFEIANTAYLELIGERGNIIGKSARDVLPEVAGQGFFDLLDQVYRTGEPFIGREVPLMLKRSSDGTIEQRYLNFVYQPTRDHLGQVSGIFVEGSDVTDAVMASLALRESEQRLRDLANTIPHLAWMADAAGQLHWYNDRWYDYTGSTPEQLEAGRWLDFIHPDDRALLVAERTRAHASGEPYEVQVRIRSAQGDYRTYFIRAAPLHDGTGAIIQWFGTDTDVTAIETAQSELRAANRRKDEFLAMLAHELRNPLAPISTAAELLKLTALDEKRVRHTSDIISRQVSHMTKLVDDLLDVSRVTRGLVTLHEETLVLNDLVADAVEQVHAMLETKHQQFTIQAPEQDVSVRGDRTRLIQVFSNLLNNAAKFTQADGRIILRLAAVDGQAEISVEDNGIGIAPPLLPYVFDLFTQAERSPDRSQGGLGLGLALVKSLVELHAGTVVAHSGGPGKGSCFTVRLPLCDAATATAAASSTAAAPLAAAAVAADARGLQLMVVDDNRDAALTLTMLLEAVGHKVAVSYDAAEAIEMARRCAPALLFLDIGLPDIDGYALARTLRGMPETAGAMLVAVTGYGQASDRARALAAGFDRHLVKPVRLGDVMALVDQAATLYKKG
ncbi:hybrid sensor histidine kinase/response regulator [Massilia soli]|uniref:histidine kinase n=1 Tax=Massilia soli TaxID=2792854 RepID=A0ABS7SR18_9BURK|nr:PAS domain-containing protein [Massilia soli]MBZ2208381.1 PAS domain-containing protein [Massilia soli]